MNNKQLTIANYHYVFGKKLSSASFRVYWPSFQSYSPERDPMVAPLVAEV